MTKTSIKLGGFLLLFLVIAAVAEGKAKALKNIKIELSRNVLAAWQQNSTKHNLNDFCFNPKESRPSRPLIFNTNMPQNCSTAKVARISQECVFKNLAYNVKIYYDPDSNSNTTSTKDLKKLEASQDYFELAVDLTSPWSWVKSPLCQTCDRTGKKCDQNQCQYKLNTTTPRNGKVFSSTNIKQVEKCGEIDLYAEGMSVVGTFVVPEKLRFKDSPQVLSKAKLLWAHALSGQEFLMADGVLGLGSHENENAYSLKNINFTNTKMSDDFRKDDAPKDEYDDYEDEEEEENEDEESEEQDQIKNKPKNNSNNNNNNNNNQNQKENKPSRIYDLYEPEMSLVEPIAKQFKSVSEQIFSLYIADDDTLKHQLLIGEINPQFIYKPEENRIYYLNSLVSADLIDQYGLWVVYVSNIRIAKLSDELKAKKKNKSADPTTTEEDSEGLLPINSISVDNPTGILSLATTAIVLPIKDLAPILTVFESEFGIKCSVSKTYLYFVVCEDISPLKEELNDLTIIIELGSVFNIHLQVNPADLILDCKKMNKTKDSKLRCQMNLQQSYDNKIILGEAALRNQYMIFDQKENTIGFAPAKNKFNSSSFIKRIGHLFNKIEQVIEQDISYIVGFLTLIILSSVAFLFFRHGKTIIALFQGKRVIVVDDKNDRIQLSQHAHETMDESAIRELQEMSQQMEDSGIQNNDFNNMENEHAEHHNDTIKPINLDDL